VRGDAADLRSAECRCPLCGRPEPRRVIYAGLPVWLCVEEACSAVWGFWSRVVCALPFNGFFFAYPAERFGSYWPALVAWLRSDGEG
jgi:hypothetical protein